MNVTNLPQIKAGQQISHINVDDIANPKLETLYVTTVNFNPTRDVLEVTLENVDGLKPQKIDINASGEITTGFSATYFLTTTPARTAFNAYIDTRTTELTALNTANSNKITFLNSLKY